MNALENALAIAHKAENRAAFVLACAASVHFAAGRIKGPAADDMAGLVADFDAAEAARRDAQIALRKEPA